MLKTRKLSDNKFEFKNSIIFKFIILGIAGLVAGYFLINIGLDGDWQQMNEETVALVVGILATVGGITSLIFGPQVHIYHFDKAKGQIFYTMKKLTGITDDSFSLNDVTKIVITQSRKKSGSDNKKKIVYKYNLLFKDEDMIELAKKEKNASSFSRIKGSQIPDEVEELSKFLGIEIESMSFKESFGEVVNTVSKMMNNAKQEKEKESRTT